MSLTAATLQRRFTLLAQISLFCGLGMGFSLWAITDAPILSSVFDFLADHLTICWTFFHKGLFYYNNNNGLLLTNLSVSPALWGFLRTADHQCEQFEERSSPWTLCWFFLHHKSITAHSTLRCQLWILQGSRVPSAWCFMGFSLTFDHFKLKRKAFVLKGPKPAQGLTDEASSGENNREKC